MAGLVGCDLALLCGTWLVMSANILVQTLFNHTTFDVSQVSSLVKPYCTEIHVWSGLLKIIKIIIK